MNLLTILGARPQFIKASPVSEALRNAGVKESILHTGQHFDENMSRIFFEEMSIPSPSYNLGIHSLSHSQMTGKMMVGIEKILLEDRPDMLMVYGDTNSTLAGALAAKKLNIPVAHVEAGLRSFNDSMPEEINRVATDSISNLLFCPTQGAVSQLTKEGYNDKALISLSGDVMYDALLKFSPHSKHPEGVQNTNYVLCTLHRQENTDDETRLSNILDAFNTLAENRKLVFPVHPRTRNILTKYSLHPNITCIDPVGYLEMLSLLKNCSLVLTDSGGLQKEAYFSKKYCITLRDETEWVELVEGGYNLLAGANSSSILAAYSTLAEKSMGDTPAYYGAGNASQIIAREIINY